MFLLCVGNVVKLGSIPSNQLVLDHHNLNHFAGHIVWRLVVPVKDISERENFVVFAEHSSFIKQEGEH